MFFFLSVRATANASSCLSLPSAKWSSWLFVRYMRSPSLIVRRHTSANASSCSLLSEHEIRNSMLDIGRVRDWLLDICDVRDSVSKDTSANASPLKHRVLSFVWRTSLNFTKWVTNCAFRVTSLYDVRLLTLGHELHMYLTMSHKLHTYLTVSHELHPQSGFLVWRASFFDDICMMSISRFPCTICISL